ncbi:MAG: DUF2007 domain-containing protein [Thermoanaerobaculales bacterium]
MYCPNRECPDNIETGKPGEYVPGVYRCPHCGADLVDVVSPEETESEPPRARAQDPAPDARFEPVFECTDPSEVAIVKSLLESEGIRFLTSGEENFDAFRGSLSPFRFHPKAGKILFMVPENQAESARAILTELETEN